MSDEMTWSNGIVEVLEEIRDELRLANRIALCQTACTEGASGWDEFAKNLSIDVKAYFAVKLGVYGPHYSTCPECKGVFTRQRCYCKDETGDHLAKEPCYDCQQKAAAEEPGALLGTIWVFRRDHETSV